MSRKRHCLECCILLLIALLPLTRSWGEPGVTPSAYAPLPTLDLPRMMRIYSINDQNEIVGDYTDASRHGRGFVLKDSVFTILSKPKEAKGGFGPSGINSKGQIVGSFIDQKGRYLGFLLSHHIYTIIDYPKAKLGTFPSCVSNTGQIVGTFFDDVGVHGFLFDHGTYKAIDAPRAKPGNTRVSGVNDIGQVVGDYSDVRGLSHGFLLNHGHYTVLDVPHGKNVEYNTEASSIDAQGHILGTYSNIAVYASGIHYHGFVFSNGRYRLLSPPKGSGITSYNAINSQGYIVGYYQTDGKDLNYSEHGFLLKNGSYTMIDAPTPHAAVMASSINDQGQIVGNYLGLRGQRHGFLLNSNVYTDLDQLGSQMTDISAINNHGQIVGTVSDKIYLGKPHEGFHDAHLGFLLENKIVHRFPLSDDSHEFYALGVNSKGDIVGYSVDEAGHRHGFLVSNDIPTTLDAFGATSDTEATGINTQGQIVGQYVDATKHTHGFLLDHGVYTTLDDPQGKNGTFPKAINDHGDIVGCYRDAAFQAGSEDGTHGFLLQAGVYTTLDAPDAKRTFAQGINTQRQIVGYSVDQQDQTQSFLWSR